MIDDRAAKLDYLTSVLRRLEDLYLGIGNVFGPPIVTAKDGIAFFRYRQHSDSLLCFLKGIKLLSTLNAALVLRRSGYAHEVNALCRMADDFINEIVFMIVPRQGDKLSRDQERFLAEFFQEEFADNQYVLGSNNPRDIVPRRKIFAAYAQALPPIINSSDACDTLTTIHKALSGYVHGAYPHIMEMYGGRFPRFHVRGLLNSSRELESEGQLISYIYRCIMVSELVARKLGLTDTEKKIRAVLEEFETQLNCRPTEDPETLARRSKRPS